MPFLHFPAVGILSDVVRHRERNLSSSALRMNKFADTTTVLGFVLRRTCLSCHDGEIANTTGNGKQSP